MFGVLMRVRFAWGFSVKAPKEAKAQSAYSVPPPTTLIGAVSKHLSSSSGLGETVVYQVSKKEVIASAASRFSSVFRAASAFYDNERSGRFPLGKYWEDQIRYQVLQFQKPTRRGLPQFRFNLIPAGKVYFPGGEMVVGLLGSEEEVRKTIGDQWAVKLRDACYAVTSIGSKEGIVEVEEVEVMESLSPISGEFETRFYQRMDLIEEVLEIDYGSAPYGLAGAYVERFWEMGYGWGVQQRPVEYIVPGRRDPVTSCRIRVRPTRNAAVYLVGKDGIAVPA
ncbi:hypothetical protein HRbin02_01416 [Candidatus Calditenuaceae archaeon HR02]|nr:hypothetical protein HRbin02_01416 [Candidatus Calditenuaceae archaeon HR02]